MIKLVTNEQSLFTEFEHISVEKAVKFLKSLKFIGLDSETSGLSCHTKDILLLQLGNKDVQIVFCIDTFNFKIPDLLKTFLQESDAVFILQNAAFDLQFLYKQGIILKNIFDTMLAEYIITMGLQEDGRDLQTLCKKYCKYDMDKSVRGEIIKGQLNSRIIIYAATDIVHLEDIMWKQLAILQEKNLETTMKLDNAFVKVLAYIEYCGMKLDWNKWKERSERTEQEVLEKQATLEKYLWDKGYKQFFDFESDLFGNGPHCIINWKSSKQVIPVFELEGIKCYTYENGVKKYSIEKKSLAKQIPNFEILKLFYDFQALAKLSSTYGLTWKSLINSATNRIHASYTQIMSTGRLSSNKPNMQNLPHDAFTRSCFIAEKGNKFISADYSAQESVILANFAKDKSLLNFYQKGLQDMHSFVAYLLYPKIQEALGKSLEELTNDDLKWIKKNFNTERGIAKTAEFAIGYGGNGYTISENTGCSVQQGEEVYNKYFSAFTGLKDYFTYVMNKTVRNGYIEFNNVTHRKYFLKNSDPLVKYQNEVLTGVPLNYAQQREYSERYSEIQKRSQNFPIQGSASDCSKLAGILFFDYIIKNNLFDKVKIVNMVHDEFCVEAPEEMADEISKVLVSCMEKAAKPFCKIVPLSADVEVGDFWIH